MGAAGKDSGCNSMRVGLIDVDGHNFPNIPLMKLSAWHKQQGDTVEWYEPLFSGHMNRVYMSKVFSFTQDYPYFVDADEVIRGGSGYCIELTDGREHYQKERDNKSLEDMHEFFVEQMFKQGKKVVYALKEIRAGDQFEVEIYPQFKKMDEVPPEGRSIKKDNDKAQRNLNDKNARKYVERLINENFTDRDLWLTFTYDNEHLPPDGDIDAAIKNVQKFIRRVNYQRKKRGLPNARYVYVTAYNPTEEIRWHHHIVMDGDMDMDVVEGCWKQSSRNEVRRLQKDENGLTGMAKYIVEEKNRVKSEKRWNSSQGLRDPDIKVVHSKRPTAKAGGYKKIGTYVETMRKGHEQVREQMLKWYPDFDFTDAGIYYNDFNSMFYIRARMRKRRQQ